MLDTVHSMHYNVIKGGRYMTLSEKIVFDNLSEILYNHKEKLEFDDLPFILTVIRDNYGSDMSLKILEMLVKKLWIQENQ